MEIWKCELKFFKFKFPSFLDLSQVANKAMTDEKQDEHVKEFVYRKDSCRNLVETFRNFKWLPPTSLYIFSKYFAQKA